MKKNILLTSLDALEDDRALQYYAVKNEYGCSYCEAVQSMEASTKYILARFPIDAILVIGENGAAAGVEDGKPLRLKDAGALSSEDQETLSAFDLYRSRIAQYINETSLEQQACDALLPEADREKLAGFVRGFQEQYSEQDPKRLNRFFDELACSKKLFARFRDALFNAFPEERRDPRLTMMWVKNFLYTQLKASAKLEILPVNENVCVRYVPTGELEKLESWINITLGIDQDDANGEDETNVFVSLGNSAVVDSHIILNILDILISTPGSNTHLKKIYKVSEASGTLTGLIQDNTIASRSTELSASAHAFLNYSKTDMLVHFWENSGVHDERISRLIYAARHVDAGISLCNINEMQEGLQQLRRLFLDERSWTEDGEYGVLFGMLAGCIRADYSALLADDGSNIFIELIKWAYKHQLYQQVLTLIETYAPATLVEKGIFYYCNDESRSEEITRVFARERMELKPYEYYKMDDLGHYFIKSYDRGAARLSGSRGEDRNAVYAAVRAQSIKKQDPGKIGGCTACDSIETVQNVLYAYYNLGTVRNKISHADAEAMAERRLMVSESDNSYAMVMMRETIEFFIMSFEKAAEEVRDKKPKIVAISPDDVRNVADRMKRELYQDRRKKD